MQRINVYADPDLDFDAAYDATGRRLLAGWFDRDKAVKFDQDRYHDGHNWVSVATGSQWHDEWVLRTAQGRWVLGSYSRYNSDHQEHYRFVTVDQAREWLLRNGHDEAVEQYFGEVEEETGPNLGGRPEIGPAINVRLPKDLLARVDRSAADRGLSRAEAIRQMLAEKLPAS
jgi:hypothetical protein